MAFSKDGCNCLYLLEVCNSLDSGAVSGLLRDAALFPLDKIRRPFPWERGAFEFVLGLLATMPVAAATARLLLLLQLL